MPSSATNADARSRSGDSAAEHTIGVVGQQWRATVSGGGAITPWDGSAPLNWYVAADDRWHRPEVEPTVRQRRLDGAPVIETRVKIPNGNAIHRVWAVADSGGLTVIEIENDSPLPFAVAFDRADVLSARPATDVPIQGIDLPEGSVVFPVGHHTTLRFGLAHSLGATMPSAERLPSAMQVARGWTAIVDRAGRVVVPDTGTADDITRWRSELALCGPQDPADDPVGFLIDVGHLVRLGDSADDWVPDVAAAVESVARFAPAWDLAAALDAAIEIFTRAGEQRAVRDTRRLRPTATQALPRVAPPQRALAWTEQTLARSLDVGGGELLGGGLPAAWLGGNVEVYGLPVGPATTVSYALRWHGDRPAVLWETTGPIVALSAPAVAPGWSTAEPSGETLWPVPPSAAGVALGTEPVDSTSTAGADRGSGGDVVDADDDPVSFS